MTEQWRQGTPGVMEVLSRFLTGMPVNQMITVLLKTALKCIQAAFSGMTLGVAKEGATYASNL